MLMHKQSRHTVGISSSTWHLSWPVCSINRKVGETQRIRCRSLRTLAQKAFRELGQATSRSTQSLRPTAVSCAPTCPLVALLHLHTPITLITLDIQMDYVVVQQSAGSEPEVSLKATSTLLVCTPIHVACCA